MSSPEFTALQQTIRTWEHRKFDLTDAISRTEDALRKIEPLDLPTAKMIGTAFLSTLQDAHRHTGEILARHNDEAARMWREGQGAQ